MKAPEGLKYFSLFKTEEENKKEYRKLALQYHPDRTKGNKKEEEIFKAIAEEYAKVEEFQKQYGVLDPKMYEEKKKTVFTIKGVIIKDGKPYLAGSTSVEDKEAFAKGVKLADTIRKIFGW
jgi:curved DNA-binding protein CbpA